MESSGAATLKFREHGLLHSCYWQCVIDSVVAYERVTTGSILVISRAREGPHQHLTSD